MLGHRPVSPPWSLDAEPCPALEALAGGRFGPSRSGMTRVEVEPALLQWAWRRSGLGASARAQRFPQLDAWERGERLPTVKQLEHFARATHVPFGALFLPQPPQEALPIADFRERSLGPASGELLDVIYAAQRRQAWAQSFADDEALDPLQWVGSASLGDAPAAVAARLRVLLDFEPSRRRSFAGWAAATRALAEAAQAIGVLVSISGTVGNNTHRPLRPAEFRGFALVDPVAPLLFVNGADHPAAHAFTLGHELAHLALGRSGLSNEDLGALRDDRVEAWCDAVAAELLAPSELVAVVRDEAGVAPAAAALARALRVSPLVAVRRVAERAQLPAPVFGRCFGAALAALPRSRAGGGGDFYATVLKRFGRRFTHDLVASVLEGKTSYIEASRLLDLRGPATVEALSRRLGMAS